MYRAINVLTVSLLVAVLSACAMDAEDAFDGEAPGEDVEYSAVPEPEAASLTDEDVGVAANCSQIQYCNAPGSIGTRCQQLGCSFNDALYECVVETGNVCGSRTCIWEFLESNGNRWHEGSCIGQSPGWWYLQ